MQHGCDAILHGAPESFNFSVLALCVGRREALKNARRGAGGGSGAGGKNGFRVGLNYLYFWFDAGE